MDVTPLHGAGAIAALAAGATGSLHCAVMCGPLACAAIRGGRDDVPGSARRSWTMPIVAWHAGRVAAYTVVGAALGSAGKGLALLLASRVQPVLPWIMAAGFVAAAFDFGRRLPRWATGLAGASHGLVRAGARLGADRRLARAFILGAATPLLPCGLLWGIFLAAIGAGTAAGGALVLGIFALGGTPGLTVVQLGASWTGRWPRVERALRVGVPLAAAAILVVRALGSGGDPGAPGGTGGMHHHH